MKIKLPHDSLVRYSIEHPDSEFHILSSRRTENRLQVVVKAATLDSNALIRTLDEAPEIRFYDVLHEDKQRVLLQIETEEHSPRAIARSVGMLPQYPMVLRDGWQTIETITSWERLSQLKVEFEENDVSFEILSVTQPVEVTDLLTDRQWEVLTEAITRGYYNTPRGCSLTDLATTLDVSPSAVSGVLHRAEEQIIKAFAANAELGIKSRLRDR
ncbi:helix-turn-helix domain-containing protein [Halopelagius fulvigenes]|uniref:Helix-turn-helix domain-containing protein n=1 Tax=Halopelagius fulvigenes TaxID=1198324 RepID=A0ABD5TSN6_9EURY